MKEEEIIRKCGTENPFTVPEGYFEQFTGKLMEQLSDEAPIAEDTERPVITLWQRVKPWFYLAAMFAGVIFSAKVFLGNSVGQTEPTAQTEGTLTDEEIDTMIEYAMVDDYTLYRYLTEAE